MKPAHPVCGDCGQPFPGPPVDLQGERRSCTHCGGTVSSYAVTAADEAGFYEYVSVKQAPAERDASLPAKGVVRSYQGVRQGRDGRLVERTAIYDPHQDLAYERVVDLETEGVIVDKSESMREKYEREGRWNPRDGE